MLVSNDGFLILLGTNFTLPVTFGLLPQWIPLRHSRCADYVNENTGQRASPHEIN